MKTKPVRSVVTIKPDETDKESGGILIPDAVRSRMQTAIDRGELIAVGGAYWKYDNGEEWPGPKPKIGDKVLFDRYAGSLIKVDGQEYRLCNDDKIIAIMEE